MGSEPVPPVLLILTFPQCCHDAKKVVFDFGVVSTLVFMRGGWGWGRGGGGGGGDGVVTNN